MQLLSHRREPFREYIINWQEHAVGASMVYSHRSTEYTRETYPSSLHFHDYYELVIYVGGDIRYICENASWLPRFGDIILIPPGKLHMSMINNSATHYTRYVFYFFANAFDAVDAGALLHFIHQPEISQYYFSLSPKAMEELLMLLGQLDQAYARGTKEDQALALAYTLQVFYLLNKPADRSPRSDSYLPASVMEIQRYLDEHFLEISSVSDVAAHFFYSREYVSRLFKKYLNTTVADYVIKRRISYSQQLMETDLSLADICFHSGFGSVSSFIRSFKSIMGMSPSKYRRMQQEIAQ